MSRSAGAGSGVGGVGRARARRRGLAAGAGALAVVAVAIQFVPVDRSGPPARHEVDAPPEVVNVLRAACYDCHSAATRWPWYARIAPVSWLIADHVREGRRELDFSDWPVIDFTAQDELLREVAREVEKGSMPPSSYRLAHPQARLDGARRDLILDWAGGDIPAQP